jgi:hypothetical protein
MFHVSPTLILIAEALIIQLEESKALADEISEKVGRC